jgi:restriction endonuclease S subunit
MTGGTPTSTVAEYYENGTVPWLVSGDIHGVEIWNCKKRITQKAVENSNARVLPKDSILIALNGQGKTRGTVALLRMEGATCNQSLVAITPSQPTSTLVEFIFLVLRSMYADIRALTGDTERSGLNMPILKSIQIPLPPLDMQKEIVAEIEGYQKVINGARAVLDNYRPHISIRPDWPMIPIIEVCTVNPRKSEINDMNENIIVSFVPMADLNENKICFQPKDTKKLAEVTSSYTYFRDDDVLLAKVTPCFENGKAGIARNLVNGIGFGSSEFYVLRPEGRILPEWVYISITTSAFRDIAKAQMTGTGGLQRVPRAIVENYQIPVPSLEIQQTIIAEIEAEQALVTANRELITRFEKKIQATLARVWGEGKKSVGEA